MEHSQQHPRPPLQIVTKESENLNIQGPVTPLMQASNNILHRSATIANTANNLINEQAYAYLKEMEAKNQTKFITQKEDLDIFKYLSLTYNVNSIVNPDFSSNLKHKQIQPEIIKASMDSIRLQYNRITNTKLNYTHNITLLNPPQRQTNEKQYEKPYKNLLTSLFFENKPDQQLLVVELVNIGAPNTAGNGAGGVLTSVSPNLLNSNQNLNGMLTSQKTPDLAFYQNYKAFPTLYHLNFETSGEPCPFIAIDKIQGRHYIYNNDDKIMVFSNEPIYSPINDKSRPLLYMSLDDKIDDAMALKANGQDIADSSQNPINSGVFNFSQGKARINPTLQIISDQKGNSALLVIGGYMDNGNSVLEPKMNIKVFNISKRKVGIKPTFQINLKQPRVNPIIIRVKQSQCKDARVSQTDDKKFILLLGGATSNVITDKKSFINTNTCCSVIEYDKIFQQLERNDSTQMEVQQTLKVSYNDREIGKSYEKIANNLSRGVFIHQKDKKNHEIHNKMFIIPEKKRKMLHVHAISLSENFISIDDFNTELKTEGQWCYTNLCIFENYIIHITPQSYVPVVIETTSKNIKSMQCEDLVEFNSKKDKDIFEKPKPNKASCACRIF